VALVNNIAPAHLERMGSLLGVADTKAAVYDALPEDGVAVINADEAFAPFFAERAHGHRLIRFGLDASADVTARDIQPTEDGSRFVLVAPQGETAIDLAMPGRHNVRNALAAASIALGLGVPLDIIGAGLNAAEPVAGRLIVHRLRDGAVLIGRQLQRQPGLARGRHRHARGSKPQRRRAGSCSATCASSVSMPGRCTLKWAGAPRPRASSACTPSANSARMPRGRSAMGARAVRHDTESAHQRFAPPGCGQACGCWSRGRRGKRDGSHRQGAAAAATRRENGGGMTDAA
jgi:hypothetical protein